MQAMPTLHGRWKLVYTSNTRTLMLLNAIQSFPLVDIGDVYQVRGRFVFLLVVGQRGRVVSLASPHLSIKTPPGGRHRDPHCAQQGVNLVMDFELCFCVNIVWLLQHPTALG